MKTRLEAVAVALAVCALAAIQLQGQGGPPLRIAFVDVEGGQATLIALPSGESILIDAGYPGFDDRDAGRIAAEAKRLGLTRLSYMVVSHYHRDHVGGVPALAARLPIGAFVDHGPTVETGEQPEALFSAYLAVRQKGRYLQARPGNLLPIAGLDVRIVASAGELIRQPIHPGSTENSLCRDFTAKDEDPSENAQSVGMVISYGQFRMLNLGDLTWNKEHGLACPANLIGSVDVYLTTHHGLASSGPPVLVHAVRPRVAIMNNGATKGGSPEAWRTVRTSPGLEDFWQLHYAMDAGPEHNVSDRFIANMDETTAHAITLTAYRDGDFEVRNGRNNEVRKYRRRESAVDSRQSNQSSVASR